MATTVADIIKTETMMASSWPAFRVCLSGRWIMGTAEGLTGRANSLFFLDPDDDSDFEKRLDWMESAFKKQGLPPRVRLSPLCPKSVMSEIQKRGYVFQKPTVVLRKPRQEKETLLTPNTPPGCRVLTKDHCDEIWLDTFVQGSPHYAEHKAGLRQLLENIMDEVLYIVVLQEERPVATAMVTHHIDIANLQNIMTLPDHRRKNYALYALSIADQWVHKHEADWTWLAVEAENSTALELYRKLNYQDFYQYIYASLEG